MPLFIAVCLVAINMRMSITGVGPMLDGIAEAEGANPATLGLLASVPLLAWAIVSPLSQTLADRVGLDTAVSLSLTLLFLATIWRSLPGSPLNLWLGTALIGIALAVTNVLLPASIKRDFGTRVPLVMGVYSALIGASGALGAAIVAPVAHLPSATGDPLGWRWALLTTGATVPIALLAWLVVGRIRAKRAAAVAVAVANRVAIDDKNGAGSGRSSLSRKVWTDPVAWWIALYMGSQSWVFYIFATWLSPIDISRGESPVAAGFHVTFFHVFGIIGSLLMPFMMRGALRRVLPAAIPLLGMLGGLGVVLAPGVLYLWLAFAGLTCGVSLSIALTFIAQRSPSTAIAGAVSGMAQSFGYLIAGLGPVLFGWFFELSGGWLLPLCALVLGGAAQVVAGVALLRDRIALSGHARA